MRPIGNEPPSQCKNLQPISEKLSLQDEMKPRQIQSLIYKLHTNEELSLQVNVKNYNQFQTKKK